MPIALCAVHGSRFAESAAGGGLFESMVVQTLSWTVQLFLNVLIDEPSAAGALLTEEALRTAFERCRGLAELDDSYESVLGALAEAGILVSCEGGYRFSRTMTYDSQRQDYIVR